MYKIFIICKFLIFSFLYIPLALSSESQFFIDGKKFSRTLRDKVKKYDPIAEVLSDKVSAEIPSSYTGEISELVAEENETVAVGTLICYMETEDIQYSGDVANYFSYVSVQQNNACLKFSSLLKTKNAAKAAFL